MKCHPMAIEVWLIHSLLSVTCAEIPFPVVNIAHCCNKLPLNGEVSKTGEPSYLIVTVAAFDAGGTVVRYFSLRFDIHAF